MTLLPTPSQTVGPFFGFALSFADSPLLVGEDAPDAVRIVGTVFDGDDQPVPDAMLEIWQANAEGRYAHAEDTRSEVPLTEGFSGFGRSFTDTGGGYWFWTTKPGRVPARDGGLQAPHISFSIFTRGLLKRVATRMYFPDEQASNEEDPVLAAVEDPDLRSTLVARAEDGAVRFDVHLQGDRETAFFAV